jgi:hypothetical protein
MKAIAMKFGPKPRIDSKFGLVIAKSICKLAQQALWEIFDFDSSTVGTRRFNGPLQVLCSQRMRHAQR